MNNVSIIVKTFERPEYLAALVKSIRHYYPSIPVLVADDSKVPRPIDGVEYHVMPFDSGVSAGRNLLVNNVKTKYFITVDDDWEFTPWTKIETFVDLLENNDIDILVGSWSKEPSICANFEYDEGTLTLNPIPTEEQDPILCRCDYSNQFFITNTEKFKEFGGWDEELKTRGEHVELYIRAKKEGLKTALTQRVRIKHEQGFHGSKNYQAFRERDFFGIAMKKHNITRFINYNGKERLFT